MEQNNKEIKFDVISNDREKLEETLNWYNSVFNTDFIIVNYVLDEVSFAEIKASKFKLTDIFNIGYAFGCKEEKLREQGLIDW